MKLIASALMFFVFSGAANADTVQDAKLSLYAWSPKIVTLTGGTLTVVLQQQRVTSAMYNSIIQSGICLGAISGRELPGVEEIVVLDEYGVRGFVFEEGTQSCGKINRTSRRAAEVEISSRTHAY